MPCPSPPTSGGRARPVARTLGSILNSALDFRRSALATSTLQVEVHFDFVCPWCLIGKRQLDAAVRRFEALVPEARVEVSWRSSELLPQTRLEGEDYEDFYIRRLGSPEAVALRRLQVKEAGRAAGVAFEFDRIRRLPNTMRAHALLAQAAAQGGAQPTQFVDRVLTAFFIEGADIGDPAVLERLGRECGLPVAALAAAHVTKPTAGPDRPSQGSGGVPFFVFDRTHAVSGAASVGSLLEALLETWQGRAARGLQGA
jgi:predicted DsbA family dithiol-disulfide isomerase